MAGKRNNENAGPRADAEPADEPVRKTTHRVEPFRELSQARVSKACVMLPTNLTGQARREHVRACLLEDHADRIEMQSIDAQHKFRKLAESRYAFFRGTALLFYRDMAGADADMPTVLVLGDVHPGNFGIMPNADNVPIFGVNDFDEAAYAPMTWDLKRGAVGFMLAAQQKGELDEAHQRRIVCRFIDGYVSGMTHYARHATERTEEFRMGNSPKIIRKLFDEARHDRQSWLWDRYLDETGRGFRANSEFTPVSSRVSEFQKRVDELARRNNLQKGGRAGELVVKDVAIRHGQGTASLGLDRFYVLLDGPGADASDDLIIEFKRARRSALTGLVPASAFDSGTSAARIAHAQSVQLANGDVFYGSVDFDGTSFMTRERAPFRDDISMNGLSKKSWRKYAHACGRALAQAHARSDEAGELDYDIEPAIVEAMEPVELFTSDVVAFAREATDRLTRDHAMFSEDFALGAFDNVARTYR